MDRHEKVRKYTQMKRGVKPDDNNHVDLFSTYYSQCYLSFCIFISTELKVLLIICLQCLIFKYFSSAFDLLLGMNNKMKAEEKFKSI